MVVGGLIFGQLQKGESLASGVVRVRGVLSKSQRYIPVAPRHYEAVDFGNGDRLRETQINVPRGLGRLIERRSLSRDTGDAGRWKSDAVSGAGVGGAKNRNPRPDRVDFPCLDRQRHRDLRSRVVVDDDIGRHSRYPVTSRDQPSRHRAVGVGRYLPGELELARKRLRPGDGQRGVELRAHKGEQVRERDPPQRARCRRLRHR